MIINDLENEFLKNIKSSKKYKTLSEDIIIKEIKDYLRKNPKISSVNKQSLKEIKSNLHRIYSSYQTKKKNKRNSYLEELKKAIDNNGSLDNINDKLLRITLSTTERINDYKLLYDSIFQLTGKPKTITDIGCGLNPLSFSLMRLGDLNYYAYDIDTSDIEFLNKYFDIMKPLGLNGHAEILDVKDIKKIEQIPNSDIIFAWKLLDLISDKNFSIETFIKILMEKTDNLVISFATKTLTRKKMMLQRRTGFEKMLERNNLHHNIIRTDNEIFYVIRKV